MPMAKLVCTMDQQATLNDLAAPQSIKQQLAADPPLFLLTMVMKQFYSSCPLKAIMQMAL